MAKAESKDRPNDATVASWLAGAVTLHQTGQLALAQQEYQRVLDARPDQFDALHMLGVISNQIGESHQAKVLLERAIAIDSTRFGIYSNYGLALANLSLHKEAIRSYRKSIAMQPGFAMAHNNLGVSLTALHNYEDAIRAFDAAIALAPNYTEAHNNLGMALSAIKKYAAAVTSFDRVLSLQPDYEYVLGARLHVKGQMCDWTAYSSETSRLFEAVAQASPVSSSFALVALTDSARLQHIAAQTWVANRFRASLESAPVAAISRTQDDAIHIGYFSSDFYDHATAHLAAGLFETHDRSKFKVTAFSFGPQFEDPVRERLVSAFDRLINVETYSDLQIAELSRELRVDIAVDLKGLTRDNRIGIFQHRAAPLQVSFLGYPGSTGASFMDYLIADNVIIQKESTGFYSEKIIFMPGSYQVNDSKRAIFNSKLTKNDCGLPSEGYVFCCFNSSFKITPLIFDCWMRILRKVSGSVLWLIEDNESAVQNLQREAEVRGVAKERLVFAKHLPHSAHLGRHKLADLFLDTFPCNAHTTASDALWAGLPVLTLAGESFASRVGASLLHAVGLPDLVTTTIHQYEQKAIELVNAGEIASLKERLKGNLLLAPLFDTKAFTLNLETAFVEIFDRRCKQQVPTHIHLKNALNQ